MSLWFVLALEEGDIVVLSISEEKGESEKILAEHGAKYDAPALLEMPDTSSEYFGLQMEHWMIDNGFSRAEAQQGVRLFGAKMAAYLQ